MKPILKLFTTSSALALLLGCGAIPSAGPNYTAPKTTVPDNFSNGTQAGFSNDETAIVWWRGFNDPELDSLVARSILNNHDLRIATANVRQSRALRHGAQSDFLPVANGLAGYSRTQYAQDAEPFVPRYERDIRLYDVGFDATWELDIFGRVRREVQSATAQLQAEEATRRDVLVTVISEVARNYFELLGAKGQLEVAQRNADNQRETLKITQAISEGGRGTELDVARAKAQMNNTLADIPPLETAIARSIHRLSVLLGQQPETLMAELQHVPPIISLPPLVAISNPAALLRRRPDVRAAERTLAAANANIGVATADFFPRVTFNGNLGFQSSSFTGLGKPGSDAYSFGPSITWAALDYGHVRSRMQAASAVTEAALASYERTVLTTLEETENSLVDYGREQTRRAYLREAATASELAAKLARQRYENGATDFLTVLDAERVLFDAQDKLAQSNTRTATSLVAVYKALGGGWEFELQKADDKKVAAQNK